uniref:Uncharacterized protein n=1 Tax=Chlamydomonas euryale TaxID=1486919 RepID=A0A7R9VF90_9CHLO
MAGVLRPASAGGAPCATDLMHYETRAIRDGLAASVKRLNAAKGYIPPMKTAATMGAGSVEQDWSPPGTCIDLKQEGMVAGSGDPQFEDMRAALLEFETGTWSGCGAKHRAFFGALRTLLSDIGLCRDGATRATQIAAAHKWFMRHRPRGAAQDPAALAALAATLSLTGKGQRDSVSSSATAAGCASGLQLQGTKHEFFAAYSSRDVAVPVLTSGLMDGGPGSGSEPSGLLATRPPPRGGPVPMVMQPSVSPQRPPRRTTQETTSDIAPDVVPKSPAVRSKLSPAARKPPNGAWLPGPYRAGGATGRVAAAAAAWEEGHGNTVRAEDEEVAALRARFAAMDTASSSAGVDQQVQAWALQRARLEEEIIRRQEASRYAVPGLHGGGGLGGDELLSPYAGLVLEQAGGLGGDGGGMPGLLTSTAVLAREVRERAAGEYEMEATEISRRVNELGLFGRITLADIEHALAPVPDKAYLECLSKLPRPGDLLPSRPGSQLSAVRKKPKAKGATKRGASGKKKAAH